MKIMEGKERLEDRREWVEDTDSVKWMPSADCLDLMQAMPFAICVIDSQSRIRYSNTRMKKLMENIPQKDASLQTLLGDSFFRDFSSSIHRLRSNPSATFSRTVDFISGNGEYFHADCTIFPVQFDRRIQLFTCQLKDRTVDIKLTNAIQRAYNRLQILTEGIADLLLEVDASGFVVFANRGWLGTPKSHLQGKPILEILPANIHDEWLENFNAKIDCNFQFTDNETTPPKYYSATLRFIEQKAGGIFAVLLVSDVTDAHDKTQELLAHRQMLQQSVVAKDKFLSIMAHDLKAPFNALISFGQLLSETMREQRYDKANRLINLINESALHSYNLLENLLTWSRAKQGQISVYPVKFSIHEAITDTFELLRSVAYSKNITCICETKQPVYAYADYNMVKTVLRNLVSNAIKFTHSQGFIYSGYSVIGSNIEVYVRDTGTGMPPDVMDSLFKEQKPISVMGTNKEKGTGLGLLVCKEFIVENGGNISVSSTLGKGTTMFFTLPQFDERQDNYN